MTVTTEILDHVIVVTLDRPESRNAINRQMSAELAEAFERFRSDHSLWVAVLAGNGKDFCAGGDIKESTTTDKRGGRVDGVITGGILREYECWKPIIGALHGNVLGGGLELALCCDMRIADSTTRFAQLEVTLGRIPGGGGTQRLARTIPPAVALELILTGERLDAERAERLGLVNHVVPPGTSREGAIAMAERIAHHSAPIAARRAKEAVYRGLEMGLADGLRLEELLARTLAHTADLREGTQAFIDRRPANFTGR